MPAIAFASALSVLLLVHCAVTGTTVEVGVDLDEIGDPVSPMLFGTNLNDDNIFDGRLNMEGIYVSASYALADAVNVVLEYSNGHRIDPSLGTAGVGQLGTAPGFPLQSMNFVYASFALKF